MREITEIIFYDKAPFTPDFEDVVKFSSVEEQDAFFTANSDHIHILKVIRNNQRLDKTGQIVVKGQVEYFERAKYMRFVTNDRTYYAFVNGVQYENEGACSILYEVDVFNTYQHDLYRGKISGTIEQAHVANNVNAVLPHSQGLNAGTKMVAKQGIADDNLEWVVIVVKPDFKINNQKMEYISEVGQPRPFSYIAIPVFKTDPIKSAPFKLNGTTYNSLFIGNVMRELFGIGADKKDNAVNNIVNMYISNHIGVKYEIKNGIVEIDSSKMAIEPIKFESVTTVTTTLDGNGTFGGYSGDSLTYQGKKLPKEALNSAIKWGKYYDVWWKALLVQAWHETQWGQHSNAQYGWNSNNWSGITYSDGLKKSGEALGMKISRGAERESYVGEVGNYAVFDSIDNFFKYKAHLLSDKYDADKSKSMYHANGGESIEHFVNGLFRPKALYNYAEGYTGNPRQEYLNAMNAIYSQMKSFLDGIDDKVVEGKSNAPTAPEGGRSTLSPQVQGAINEHIGQIGKPVGYVYGTYQCYGQVAEYIRLLINRGVKSPRIGHHINFEGRIGPAQWAVTLSEDFTWEAYGWKIIRNPTPQQLLESAGAITVLKAFQSGPSGTLEMGHTCTIIGVSEDKTKIICLEQNNYNPATPNVGYQYVNRTTYDINYYASVLKAIILPPGAGGNIVAGAGQSGSITQQIERRELKGVALRILKFTEANAKVVKIPNLFMTTREILEGWLKEIGENTLELATLNSDLVQYRLSDAYGNSYDYQPQFGMLNENKDEPDKVVFMGALGENNAGHVSLLDYFNNRSNKKRIDGGDFWNVDSKFFENYPSHLNHGFIDVTGKNLPILVDSMASWLQSNRNANEATKASFKENKEMLSKQIALSNKQVNHANDMSAYSAQYSVDTAKFGVANAGLGMATGALKGFASGETPLGALAGAGAGLLNGGMGFASSLMSLNNAQTMQGFALKGNALNFQTNNLSNMQAKLSLTQSIRAYHAGMSDLQNAPDTIQSMGNDLALQVNNGVNHLYWSILLPDKRQFLRLHTYYKLYGVILNQFYNDVQAKIKDRKLFNYIKMIDVTFSDLRINQSHLMALKAIYTTGTRIWNYSEAKNNKILFDKTKENK